MRPHIIRDTAAITVILATRIPATTRATSASAGAATTGLGGGIGTTEGIMADGAGGPDAAGTVVAGMPADGVAIIDSESRPRCPRVFLDSATIPPGGKVKSVHEAKTEFKIDFEDGSSAIRRLADPDLSVAVRDKNNAVEYLG